MDEMENFYPALDEKELKDGTMKLVSVEGTPILFIKQGGKIFAFDNRCPHQGCAFSGGKLDGLVVVCPCHGWRFNLESGEYEEEPAFTLNKYEWMVKDGKIWVKLED
jgi:3-phenylpropionate/trans-cinnamate dioxygenase ferredoxin subunit